VPIIALEHHASSREKGRFALPQFNVAKIVNRPSRRQRAPSFPPGRVLWPIEREKLHREEKQREREGAVGGRERERERERERKTDKVSSL